MDITGIAAQEALQIGRALEKLNFAWFEEMMNEQSIASYAWLANQLDIAHRSVPSPSPANTSGPRDWVLAGACDMVSAVGAQGIGGISPT